MRNKTDRTDAQGIAHIVYTGWFLAGHVKSEQNFRKDELSRRFMGIPGVRPISALAFKTSVDDP